MLVDTYSCSTIQLQEKKEKRKKKVTTNYVKQKNQVITTTKNGDSTGTFVGGSVSVLKNSTFDSLHLP